MDDIVKDLSAITSLPSTLLDSLIDKAKMCISYSTSNLKSGDTVSIDIGLGALQIHLEGEELYYKFIPSKKLDESIRASINGKVELISTGEEVLVSRIKNVYRDLI